jgi:hypothetical protein
LETRGGKQVVPEVEEVERGHRLQHADHADQQILDLIDATQAGHRRAHVGLVHGVLVEDPEDAVELPDDLFEPQLVRLVDHDEEHLVVHCFPATGALQLLRSQKGIQIEIVGVVDALFAHMATWKLVTLIGCADPAPLGGPSP